MEYIKIPKWINFEMINSSNLSEFISSAEYIDNNKISFEYLRKYYMENSNKGIDIIDELALRGFEFHYFGLNNLIPDFRYNDSEEILINNNTRNKIFNMNLNLLGLKNLISRFNINCDNFFNFIPLKGFRAIIKNPNYNLIKNEFINAGFKVIESNRYENVINIYKEEVVLTENIRELDSTEDVDLDIDSFKEKYPELGKVIIEVAFSENKYNVFRRFCYHNNKKTLADLNNEDIKNLPLQRGIGAKRYSQIIERLEDVINNLNTKNDENRSIYSKDNLLINNIFKDTKFSLFRNFCKTKNLIYIDDINEELVNEFSKADGVVKVRLQEVISKLEELNISLDFTNQSIFLDIDSFKIGKEDILKEQKITHIFSSSRFNAVRRYCKKKNITTLLELTNKDILEYKNQRGIGKKKFNEFIDTLKSTIDKILLYEEHLKHGKFIINEEAFIKFKDMKISIIAQILGINDLGIDGYIRDMQGKQYSEIVWDNKDRDLLNKLNTIVIRLNNMMDINEIIKIALEGLDSRETLTIIARFEENLTLQEAGEILELTKERVRQIEKKALIKIKDAFNKYKLIENLKLMFKSNNHYKLKDLESILNTENRFLISLIKEKKIKNQLFYYEPLDMVFFNPIEDKINILEKELDQLPEYGLIQDIIESIDEIILDLFNISLGYNEIIEFIRAMGYRIYGKYFSKNKLTYTAIIEILFKYYFKDPIRLDKASVAEINRLTKEIFDLDYVWTERNIDTKLRYLEEIILTDRKTFCHLDNLDNNIFLMNQIKVYIDDYLKNKEDAINIEIIFNEFKQTCIENKIYNKVHLYSLIKYNFDDYYNTSFGNTLTITTRDNKEIKTTEERVIDYIISKGGVVSKKEVGKYFQWKPSRIENIISNSDKLITFERHKITTIDIIFENEKEIKIFNKIVSREMKKGYATANIIFNEMMFNDITFNFINRNKIKHGRTIANIIRKINQNITGHTNFLYHRQSKYSSMNDVLLEKFHYEVNRREVYQFIKSLGYSESTAMLILNNLIEDKHFKETSIDKIIPADKLNVDKSTMEKLKEWILEEMGDEEYLSLSGLKNYRRKLPNISFRWNPYIIRSIVEDNGFKSVIRENGDYRYDCVIILKEESKINKFDELVYYILKNKYKGNLHEERICEYLVSIDLLKENDKGIHKLPFEISNSNLFKIDNTGRVFLKDVTKENNG